MNEPMLRSVGRLDEPCDEDEDDLPPELRGAETGSLLRLRRAYIPFNIRTAEKKDTPIGELTKAMELLEARAGVVSDMLNTIDLLVNAGMIRTVIGHCIRSFAARQLTE